MIAVFGDDRFSQNFPRNVRLLKFVKRYSCNIIPKISTCTFAVHVNVVLRGQIAFLNFQIGHVCMSKVLLFQMDSP